MVSSSALRFAIASALFLSGTLGQIDIAATKLTGFEGCGKIKNGYNKIYEGWRDAIKLAREAKSINWNDMAAVEYLGAPQFNLKERDNIQKILDNAASFDEAWFFNPFAWSLHVRCDDWDNQKCAQDRSLGAYASNDDPKGSGRASINFCSPYFEMPSLKSQIEKGKKLRDDELDKWDLSHYQNTGTVFLHEMMHVDLVSKAGGPHIRDRYILYKYMVGDKVRRKRTKVYGPYLAKMLAAMDKDPEFGYEAGYNVRTTAENMPMYALARYVQHELGTYPNRPHLDGAFPIGTESTDGTGVVLTEQDLELIEASSPFATLEDADDASDEEKADYINYTGRRAPDSAYPEEYIKQREEWSKQPKATTEDFKMDVDNDLAETEVDTKLLCQDDPLLGDINQPYCPESFILPKIEEACKQFKDIELNPSSQKMVNQLFPIPGTGDMNSLIIGALWNIGDASCVTGRAMDETECREQLRETIVNCDTDTQETKHGGQKLNNCIVWATGINGPAQGFNSGVGTEFECHPNSNPRWTDQCECSDGTVGAKDDNGNCIINPKGKRAARSIKMTGM